MNIPMPSPEEKEKACEMILKKAYAPSFSRKIYDCYSSLGFRNLWVGVEWCVLVPVVMTLIYLGTVIPDAMKHGLEIPLQVFFVSPLFYGCLLFLTLWKEWEDEVYVLKQACYFSTPQLTSLRCLCFGGISLGMQLISLGAVVFLGGKVSVSVVLFSFSCLLFYGGLSLFTLRRWDNLVAHGFTFGFWVLLSLMVGFVPALEREMGEMLSHVSIGFLLFSMVPSCLFFVAQMKKYFLEGELSC